MPHKFSDFIKEKVRHRANFLCEYCHADERWQFIPFTIDHIIPIAAGGADSIENLALACFHCNRRKSDKQFIGGIPIFNPRAMIWNEHFMWSKDALQIIPKSEIGEV